MSIDVVEQLSDDWWSAASTATRWKTKYECMKEIFKIFTGNKETNVAIFEIKMRHISHHKKGNDLMKILTNWLVNENHTPTRIAILRLMPKLIQSFPKKLLVKYKNELFKTMLTKQWTSKKKPLSTLVTPILMQLWLKTGVELNSATITPFLLAALKHRGQEARFSACDFISKCTMFPRRKAQIMRLCQECCFVPLLAKLSMTDKNKYVKIAGCKAMYGLNEMGIMDMKLKASKQLSVHYKELLSNRRGRTNFQAAVEQYAKDLGQVQAVQLKPRKPRKPRILLRKGFGGKLEPYGVQRNKHKAKKPRRFVRGRAIDIKSLEDNGKALDYATRFNACNQRQAFNKLAEWIGNNEDSLRKTAKITDRVRALQQIAADIKEVGNHRWSAIYDGIIGLAASMMGWHGADARNPVLAKCFLSLISDAMAKGESDKDDHGLFTVYLKWALERLAEPKFNKLASECLLSTCYQYAPKVVFSVIEKLIFEPGNPANDTFKTEKRWVPIVRFIGVAVKEFGVDNFYVCRLIYIIHQKMLVAKNKYSKQACYSSLTELYQQLGDDWRQILIGPAMNWGGYYIRVRPVDAGTYIQLRCTKKEALPKLQVVEVGTYNYAEEVEESDEVQSPPPAPAPPPPTDSIMRLIEMRDIGSVETLQTWLHRGRNVSIVESSVNRLLSVLLPWLSDLMNAKILLSDNQRYQQTYQILQLLKFCSKFKTFKILNKAELILFFKVLLSSLTYDNMKAVFGDDYKRILGEINDILITSIFTAAPIYTLCALISLLKECDPSNYSLSALKYTDACCKLVYKVIKTYDRFICQNSDRVQQIYIEIVEFFSAISLETWQRTEAQRRFPIKVIQLVIARLVWFCGTNSRAHLNAAIGKLQNKQQLVKNERLIMDFIDVCENNKLHNTNHGGNNKIDLDLALFVD